MNMKKHQKLKKRAEQYKDRIKGRRHIEKLMEKQGFDLSQKRAFFKAFGVD
jgi:hypothetical protein